MMRCDKLRDTCPTCGPVTVNGQAVSILTEVYAAQNVYGFACPRCSSPVVKMADDATLWRLLRKGARRASRPSLFARREPITEDEVIAFREALARMPTARR